MKKVFLEIHKIHKKHLCKSLLFDLLNFLINFIKKETLAQVFSGEFCEIFKNTLFHRTPLVAATVLQQDIDKSEWVTRMFSPTKTLNQLVYLQLQNH